MSSNLDKAKQLRDKGVRTKALIARHTKLVQEQGWNVKGEMNRCSDGEHLSFLKTLISIPPDRVSDTGDIKIECWNRDSFEIGAGTLIVPADASAERILDFLRS